MKKMNFLNKKKALLAAAVLSVTCGASMYLPGISHAAGYMALQEQAIKVLPIDNAKFLQGQKFDFAIEVKNGSSDMDVKVNGQDAAKFFGKDASRTMEGTTAIYRIDDVSFKKAGNIDIEVKDGSQERKANYVVTNEKAKKTAKNVIFANCNKKLHTF